MSEIKWPKTMPILDAEDMVRNRMHSSCGTRHCLLGHSLALCVRNVISYEVESIVDDTIKEAIAEATNTPVAKVIISKFNDHNDLTINAKIWNRAMYLLGYTEGNPQSKRV